MLDGLFSHGGMRPLKQDLEALERAHREASHNLANAMTPGFSSRETDFRAQLLEAGGAPPKGAGWDLYLADVAPSRPGVNVERELARLSTTTLEQAAVVRVLTSRYETLRTAITEGKR